MQFVHNYSYALFASKDVFRIRNDKALIAFNVIHAVTLEITCTAIQFVGKVATSRILPNAVI